MQVCEIIVMMLCISTNMVKQETQLLLRKPIILRSFHYIHYMEVMHQVQ